MKSQTMFRGNDNKKEKLTKSDKMYAYVAKLKRKAAADAAAKLLIK